MSSEPLPDHYRALGIDRSADAATIKKTYRKLVLTCHPDKVTDPALKAQKQDEFHKIQQAYETLSDETRRATYEAELKLAQLRREKLARTASGSTVEPKTARFDVKTAGGATYTTNGAPRYSTEERTPSGAKSSRAYEHDDERYYDSRRKTEESYFPSPRPSPPSRSSREKYDKESSSRSARPSTTDRTRSSATKARDSERRDRTTRFPVPVDSEGSSADEKRPYGREYARRSTEDEPQRRAEERRRDDRRDDRRYDTYENVTPPRKLSVQEKGEDDAIRYMYKSRAEVEANTRPSPVRTTSRDYYDPSTRSSRHREVRPEPAPRRSSARPKDGRPGMTSRRETDRGIPEVVEWDDRRPTFKQSSSSPAEIRIPPAPQRAQTDSSPRDYRRSERSPPRFPGLNRSATMPVPGPDAGSRRETKTYTRPSGLRKEANSSPERETYANVPAPVSNKTYYSYNPTEGGVKAMDPPPHRTVLREPERTRHRSPSPIITKPPMGANRPGLHSSKTYTPGRSSRQSSPVREERGRSSQMKYGEVSSDYTRRRGMPERQPSYSPHNVSYSRKYGPEDVRWAPRESSGYTERKPGLGRTTTSVY